MVNKKKILKSIQPFEEQKRIHQEKIEKEKGRNYFVLEYWEKQIKRFDDKIKVRKEQLKKR